MLVQLQVEMSIPRNYTVNEAIQAAIEELNVRVVHHRLLNRPDMFDLTMSAEV